METVERITPGMESWDSFAEEHLQRYRLFEKSYAGKRILDAACGVGYGSHLIASSGAASVLGIDVADEAVRYAQLHYRENGLSYRKHDCMQLKGLGQTFDLVVSFETIEHLPEPEGFMREVAGVLADGGTFICSTPNKTRLSGAGNINPFHPSELYLQEFLDYFKKYFHVQAVYHQSESVNHFRYLELRHMIHQADRRAQSSLFSRLDSFFRKLIGRPYQYLPFMRTDLLRQYPGDIVMEPMQHEEAWHKTYVIVGTRR